VTQTKPPGVDLDKEGLASRTTPDMKGCYALIYRREDADSEVTIGNLRLPPQRVVDEVKMQLQEDFVKETMEGNKSVKVWNELSKLRLHMYSVSL